MNLNFIAGEVIFDDHPFYFAIRICSVSLLNPIMRKVESVGFMATPELSMFKVSDHVSWFRFWELFVHKVNVTDSNPTATTFFKKLSACNPAARAPPGLQPSTNITPNGVNFYEFKFGFGLKIECWRFVFVCYIRRMVTSFNSPFGSEGETSHARCEDAPCCGCCPSPADSFFDPMDQIEALEMQNSVFGPEEENQEPEGGEDVGGEDRYLDSYWEDMNEIGFGGDF